MAKDDGFLKVYLVDCQNEMRWRPEVEYKLLNVLMVLCPVIVTAVVAIKERVHDRMIFLILTISMATLLTVLTTFIVRKIKAEHKVSAYIGERVVKIWEYFNLFDRGAYIHDDSVLDEKSREYGKGRGYLRTLRILWAITIVADIILITIGVIGYVI